jgi:predicted enzyme related to lactoylglutathione lyase
VNEKSTIPGEGQVAYVQDTEGNLLGLKQPR